MLQFVIIINVVGHDVSMEVLWDNELILQDEKETDERAIACRESLRQVEDCCPAQHITLEHNKRNEVNI